MARKTSRRRSSRRTPRLDFAAIEIVGALLTPDIVASIASFESGDQTEEAYGIPPGLKVRDEIARYFRIGEALWHQFDAAKAKSSAASERFVLALLKECFGFVGIKIQKTVRKDERDFPVRHVGLDGRVPIVIAPVPVESARRSGVDESLSQFGDGGRRRSATLLLQEYLNAEDDALWGICTDGLTLRLLRDNISLTRPAWIEADLAQIFSEGLFPDFSALWLLIHQSRFGSPFVLPADCALERWRDAGRIEGVAARYKLRQGVEQALLELGQGFIEHPANNDLRKALTDGSLTRQGYFEQLLRLVYRLIFLFAAEDRDLLHLPGASPSVTRAYADGYSVARLRERCTRRTSWDKNTDVWEGLKATFYALAEGQALLGLPALGGLFSRGQHPHLRASRIENRRLLAAIWRLAWMRPEGQPLTRVNWRDMETEELGSVYESLLELTPIASADRRTFTFAEGDLTRGNARKVSGSYYTPDSLVQALLDESLDPLIEETIAGKDDRAAIEALLNLRIIDPACGSGHFLLAAARRLASRIARLSSPGTPSEPEYQHWLREVARRCLFGVDRNPMAIELAKVALWIETVEPGKPLSFLDAHLRCGDSLLGVYDLSALRIGISDDAYKALTGDDKKAASSWKARNKSEREAKNQGELAFFELPKSLLESARALEALAEDDLASVEKKAKAYLQLFSGEDRHRMETACDLYVASLLMPKIEPPVRTVGGAGAFIPTSRDVWDKLAGSRPLGLLETGAVSIAKAARAFHWPLEFPQVFFPGAARKSGFDLAIGNPPWERIKLQEQEFFAAHSPEIATAPNKAERQILINELAEAPRGSAKRALYEAFVAAKRNAEASSLFARTSGEAGGRFPLTRKGDVNTYALFSELFSSLARRAGIIVPTGIATEATTAPLFSHLASARRISTVLSFREIRRWFVSTDDRNPFCLLSLAENVTTATFAFSLDSIQEILDRERRFSLSPSDLTAINPNTRTAPVFRSKADADLVKQIYSRHSVLVDESKEVEGNPWLINFTPGIHMSGASGAFRTARQLSQMGAKQVGRVWKTATGRARTWLPLVEAKMVHQYNHRWGTYDGLDERPKNSPLRRQTPEQLNDPHYEVAAWYWIEEQDVFDLVGKQAREWVPCWRDGARNTDQRSLIVSIIPSGPIVGDLPTFTIGVEPQFCAALISTMNSLVVDFCCRLKISGGHIKQYHIQQLPIPLPTEFHDDLGFIIPRVLELTYTSHAMKPFADDLGYSGAPFLWNEDRRALLRAELDAKIAKLYGLTRDQLRYILDPADVYGPAYPSETFRVLKNNDIAKYGEYRTAKLVLQAFDQLNTIEMATEVVKLDNTKVEIRTTSREPTSVADGAWARPRVDQRGETGAVLVALLRAMSRPMPASRVRLAAIFALEPRLLHAYLDRPQTTEWKRLVGEEAEPLPSGAVQFVPPTDQHWGAVVRGLRTSGALIEDSRAGTWAPGRGFDQIDTQGWPDGRARFVLDALLAADENTVIHSLPAEVRRWLDAEAA